MILLGPRALVIRFIDIYGINVKDSFTYFLGEHIMCFLSTDATGNKTGVETALLHSALEYFDIPRIIWKNIVSFRSMVTRLPNFAVHQRLGGCT